MNMKFMLNTEAFGTNKLNRNKLIDTVYGGFGDESEINSLSNTDLLTIAIEDEGYRWCVSDNKEDLEEIIEKFINGEMPEDAILSTQDFINQEEITLTDIEIWCNKTEEKITDLINLIIPKVTIKEYLKIINSEDLGVIDFDILYNFTEGMGYWSFCLEDLSEIPNLKEVVLVDGKRYFETVQTDCI